MENVVTPYSVAYGDGEKEKMWEKVRLDNFPQCPSRLKSFYCFSRRETAEAVAERWFRNDKRRILEVRIVGGSSKITCDAKLLNVESADWEHAAKLYWSGLMTKHPISETLVDGMLYFPEWQVFPIGLGV